MQPPEWYIDIQHFGSVVDAIIHIPLTMIFEEGEVYGTFQDLKSPRLQRSMSRKLKRFIRLEPFNGNPEWLEGSRIPYRYYEHSSRKIAFKRRMTLKSKFPKHRGILQYARIMSQKEFLQKVKPTDDIRYALRINGFKDLKHLWQVCHNKNIEIPEPQKSLTTFMR